jgi:hypothetical protein
VLRRHALAATTAALLAGASLPAAAADDNFCREYARTAMNQLRSAEKHRRCEHFLRDQPARWSGDYKAHYEWCRTVKRDQAWNERNIRKRELERCERARDPNPR